MRPSSTPVRAGIGDLPSIRMRGREHPDAWQGFTEHLMILEGREVSEKNECAQLLAQGSLRCV